MAGVLSRRSAFLFVAVAAAVLAPAGAASAATCSPTIAGPNDPLFAPSERAATVGTYNVEQWYLYDLCGRSHWQRQPGTDHDYQGHRFDGWAGIIKYTYDGNSDANCPRGLK